MDLVQIALVVGIPASIATTVWGINGGGRWAVRQIKRTVAMWRTNKQMQADIKTLQEQLATLTKRWQETDYTAITGIAKLHVALDELKNIVTQVQTELAERESASKWQEADSAYLKQRSKDIEQRVSQLQQQVKELSKGWVRIGGGKTPPE